MSRITASFSVLTFSPGQSNVTTATPPSSTETVTEDGGAAAGVGADAAGADDAMGRAARGNGADALARKKRGSARERRTRRSIAGRVEKNAS
jgi:hypothetical protein